MPEYLLGTKAIQLRPTDVIGKGGEADIFRRGSQVFKIYKPPGHPDFAGAPQEQQVARMRIEEHQQKLPAFPRNLPPRVMTPQDLVRDRQGKIAGYLMQFVEPAEVLLRYGERGFRDQGVPDDLVRDVFLDLHKTVEAVHRANVVVGDFNDLNVLVKDREAFIIDADSMQFGPFQTRVFTAKFVDPLICDPQASMPMMMRPHSPETDWYAYLIMLMQSLLFVGPYGGVYRPADKAKMVPHDRRPLKRITIFDPEVRYPKPARHFKILPDTLLHLFAQAFQKDQRMVPPRALIESLRFTTCSKCGVAHARQTCPDCVGFTPVAVKEIHAGKAKGVRELSFDGVILYATLQRGQLRFIYYEKGSYKREKGEVIVQAPLDPSIRFRISGGKSLLGFQNQCLVFEGGAQQSISVDALGQLPLIDANEDYVFAAQAGALNRFGSLGFMYPERVGNLLQNQSLFWVGDTLGFGFYRAAELSNFFVFRPARIGINDSVRLPPIRGQLVDATCCIVEKRIWFFTSTLEGGRAINRAHLLDEQGKHLGSAEASPGDGSWLGTLRGKCAVSDFLLAPTDDGVVRVSLNGNALDVSHEYPDTSRFVDANSQLFIKSDGLRVVGRHDVWHVVMT